MIGQKLKCFAGRNALAYCGDALITVPESFITLATGYAALLPLLLRQGGSGVNVIKLFFSFFTYG
jgi:hypothetical protein